MGFRAAFLKHEGFVACHSEMFLHVMNKFDLTPAMSVLIIGVDNGGSLQLWRELVGDVVALDTRSACEGLDLGVLIGDVKNKEWLRSVLGVRQFDLIIDSSGDVTGSVWPWLKVNGFFVVEHYDDKMIRELMTAVVTDSYSWLPYEEVMTIHYQPEVVMIEKRNPRVVPYLDIIVGQSDPVVPESVYTGRGGKRVKVAPELLEKL
jgi:hypothetical protein